LAIYLICNNTNLSLNEIKRCFNGALNDHTSVRSNREQIKSYISQKLPDGEPNQTQIDLINIEELLSNSN
jgi:chromosomal replication initiation ATPase DnaA